MNISETDQASYYAVRDRSNVELLAYAAKQSGKSPVVIQREFSAMAASTGQINLVEYVRTGLFRAERFTADERARFISNDLHWPITHKCNNNGWVAVAEDKVVAATLLRVGGVATPETLAVIDRSARLYPGLPKVSSESDLSRLLADHAGKPLFCKILDGMVSFGAFRIEHHDASQIVCAGHPPMTPEAFLTSFVGQNVYLVQRALTNHAALTPYASALATVRMINLVSDTQVLCPMAVIKLPQGDNIADAFWRPGNIACGIDVETGRITTVARRGMEMEYLDDHPDVAGLMGLQLPMWTELRQINARAAQLFAPIRYQSTDIAITPDGPVIVELNYGGGFDLPQYANGRGMLTREVRAFFETCGVTFEPKKKGGFFWNKG